jgi:serine/threonine protein kinase
MGVVYRGHHAMLRRPTAVKLLDVEKTNEETIARFEREVQLTAGLNHPNTIAIYDFGRTPEGVFYYAMEYLDGIDLEELVRQFGPQPEGRAIEILCQVCGSLAEAHGVGLVHRDIKPANIILTQRGGVPDFAKLLDFGLVKAVDSQRLGNLTTSGSLTGTPLYMSPEAIESPHQVDARSDLYAVGGIGYYLLTGTPVFEGQNVIEICAQHVESAPEPPSARLGRPIAADLEAVILHCLAKKQEDRPASAEALEAELAACQSAGSWTRADARLWWQRFRGTPGEAIDRSAPTQAESYAEKIVRGGPASAGG